MNTKAVSGYSNVGSALTEKAGVKVKLGELSVSSSDVQTVEEEPFWINSTISCSGDYCGEVTASIGRSGQYLGDTVEFEKLAGDNPENLGVMNSESKEFNVKYEALKNGTYNVQIRAESNESSVSASENEITIEVKEPGYIEAVNSSVSSSNVQVGDSFTFSGTIECKGETECGEVDAYLEYESGEDLSGEGDLTVGTNPYSCGTLIPGDNCEPSWNVDANSEGDYSLRIKAVSTEGGSDKGGLKDITVEPAGENYLVFDSLSYKGSDSKNLKFNFEYNSSMIFDAKCSHEDSSQSCSKDDIPPGAGTKSCSLQDPIYSNSNTISCELRNSSLNKARSKSKNFEVKGSISSSNSNKNTLNLYNSNEVIASCSISNTGDIALLGGSNSKGYSAVNIRLIGPDGYTESKKVIQQSNLDPGGSTTIQRRFYLPKGANKGSWTLECYDYRIMGVLNMSTQTPETSFEVVNESQENSLNLNILEPSASEEYVKGGITTVKAVLEDNEGERMKGASVKANGLSLNYEGNGVYKGELTIPEVDKNTYEIEVEASKDGYTSDRTYTVITLKEAFEVSFQMKDVYRIGETVQVEGNLDIGRSLEDPKVNLKFYGPSGEMRGETSAVINENEFSASFSLNSGLPKGTWRLNVTAEDKSSVSSETKMFGVKPALRGEFYLDFILPEERTFKRGSKVPIEVEAVESRTGKKTELERINCRIRNDSFSLERTNSHYSTVYKLPKDIKTVNTDLSCTGTRKFEGEEIKSKNSLMISIKSIGLSLEVLKPSDTEFKMGEEVKFKVNVTALGKPVKNASISFYLNGKRTSLNFNNTKEGIYERKYKVKQNINSFSFEAEDNSGNEGASEVINARTIEEEGWNWTLFLIYFIIFLGSSFVVYLAYSMVSGEEQVREVERTRVNRRREKLKDRLDDLEMKLRSIESSRKEAQRNYYKRNIDEKTFKQLMQKYEQERTEVRNEIEEIKKELEKEGGQNG